MHPRRIPVSALIRSVSLAALMLVPALVAACSKGASGY